MKKVAPEKVMQVWVIRPGTRASGDATERFLEGSFVGLEDSEMGDLSELSVDRDVFYRKYGETHSGDTKISISGVGGKFFCFIHEIGIGDTILMPSRKDRKVFVGVVKSRYTFDRSKDMQFPHKRRVDWQYVFSKSSLTIMAQRELGAARTLFRAKKGDSEVKILIQQGKAEPFAGNVNRGR